MSPGDAAAPLELDEARRLLDPLVRTRSVLLAVSGGPDSVALMGLAAAVSRAAAAPSARLAVATVDHGLRSGSRRDAEGVIEAATSLGLPAYLLNWDGPKPVTRLQERARRHRYALLTGCAARIGATEIATAHTLDDQAETVLFRMMRGSGVSGLAGMRPRVERGGIRHLRPFLGVAKARLVATCDAEGWPYRADPANTDPRFARTRLRALMPALAAEGLDAARFAVLSRRMAEADAALHAAAVEALREAATAGSWGRYGATSLVERPAAVLHIALQLLMAEVRPSGRPRLARVERLAAELRRAVAEGTRWRRTLGECLFDFDGRDAFVVSPAPGRTPRPLANTAGDDEAPATT